MEEPLISEIIVTVETGIGGSYVVGTDERKSKEIAWDETQLQKILAPKGISGERVREIISELKLRERVVITSTLGKFRM
jgi:hypothetical protein